MSPAEAIRQLADIIQALIRIVLDDELSPEDLRQHINDLAMHANRIEREVHEHHGHGPYA